ncbi:hypothetical protein Ae201684P_009423 [Aphanomyces euteiches]|nr:hypothetical protein Ae201684P_009423 [Aphanomyces euteiches]
MLRRSSASFDLTLLVTPDEAEDVHVKHRLTAVPPLAMTLFVETPRPPHNHANGSAVELLARPGCPIASMADCRSM